MMKRAFHVNVSLRTTRPDPNFVVIAPSIISAMDKAGTVVLRDHGNESIKCITVSDIGEVPDDVR